MRPSSAFGAVVASFGLAACVCVTRGLPTVPLPAKVSGDVDGPAIVVVNHGSEDVCYVVMHRSGSIFASTPPAEQINRLRDGERVHPGEARGWKVERGEWDVWLSDCYRRPLDSRHPLPVGETPVAVELTDCGSGKPRSVAGASCSGGI